MLIGYMRVSSDSDRQTTNLQHDALTAAGIDERHLFEDHCSGARDDRPGLRRALAYLKAGDTLVVWKLDRLGRSLAHLLKIVKDLQTRGIGFKSLTEQIDTTTAHGEFLLHIFGALSQYERSLARERILAGVEAARKRGRKGGRPSKIDEETKQAIVSALRQLTPIAVIGRTFKIPRSTLIDSIKRWGHW